MGKYNPIVLTTAGQSLLTSVLGTQGTLTFTKFQTSSYQYASGTDLSALTSLLSVEQEVSPSAGGIKDATTLYSSSTVDNTGITTEYNVYTVGLFASDGVDEVLFAVSTAITPDIIPVDDGGTPSTYTYNMDIVVSSTQDITVVVNPGGGGGHVIVNSSGTDMPQRAKLKFTGSSINVTDDAANDATVVNLGASTGSIVISQSGSVVSSVEVNNAVGHSIALDALFNTNAPTYSIVSSDSTVATATLNAAKTVLTVIGLKAGNVTITISTPATSEYTAASVTLSVKSNVFIPQVGSTYKLGSGAHTGGTADLECVVLDVDGDNAVCITKGVYCVALPGISELTSIKSTYFGNLASAVSGLYLARLNADGSDYPDYSSDTIPNNLYVFNGTSFVTTYTENAISAISSSAAQYKSLGGGQYSNRSWLGNRYSAGYGWNMSTNGKVYFSEETNPCVIAPSFILDLTKVKLHGSLIVEINAGDMPKIVTWANGTDAEIVAMVQSSDRGELDLTEYWSVGDERGIHLDAMAATGVGESHVAQDATLVLLDGKHLYEFTTPTTGRIRGAFNVGLKNNLLEAGYINDTNTNTGSWKESKRRAWCNNIFFNAFPSSIRSIFKQFKTLTAQTYNGTTNEYTDDYFALPAGKEVFGADGNQGGGYSNQTEGNALTQFTYYATSANRIKKLGDDGSANLWWERSPDYANAGNFCRVNSDGSANTNGASHTNGLAPFGVI